ncbi:hypothetical protein AALP_AA1G190600 [Arabis alpina]|uniref:Uncharacterized protein n=1 Tax=Arabis alpina TaxID=50452 RepID=A0A087HP61_ARAAL|nr:hypothetical protein AALP_AA1G190600 [Arabis alpina]
MEKASTHAEAPRRRPKSKPPFESFSRICLELNKESLIFSYKDTFPYFLWEPGDTLDNIEDLPQKPWYTLPHKNQQSHYLPFLEPKEINQQRLSPLTLLHIMKPLLMNLDVPKLHQFAPKLSRLKTSHNLPYYVSTALFHLFCAISFDFLANYSFH